MKNSTYDRLNKLQRWLPSLAVFWLAISAQWGLPYGDQVKDTIIALATLLGATLEIVSGDYYKQKSDKPPDGTAEPIEYDAVYSNENEIMVK